MMIVEQTTWSSRDPEAVAWEGQTLDALIVHIVRHHHAYTRGALDRLQPLATKALGLDGAKHPWLSALRDLIAELDDELRPHMTREEHVLFPYIEQLAAATQAGRRPDVSPHGTVQNPGRMMMLEHDHCGAVLGEIRRITSGFALPGDASASLAALYATLEELERDLLQHIHLESNILFPKAIALESAHR